MQMKRILQHSLEFIVGAALGVAISVFISSCAPVRHQPMPGPQKASASTTSTDSTPAAGEETSVSAEASATVAEKVTAPCVQLSGAYEALAETLDSYPTPKMEIIQVDCKLIVVIESHKGERTREDIDVGTT